MDVLEIPVQYKGEQLLFTARILSYGYTYKLSVDVNGTEVLFERDEQGAYRAVLADAKKEPAGKADQDLIRTLLDTLNTLGGD
jgi:hypothetical protein